MKSHPGMLFHLIGRFIKSAAAPLPSPELCDLRASTALVREAAGHLTQAADDMKKSATDIGLIARQLRDGDPRRRTLPPRKRVKTGKP